MAASARPGIFLSLAAYLTIGAVYVLTLSIAWGRAPVERIIALTTLFALFTLLQVRFTGPANFSLWQHRAYFLVQGILAAAILFLAINAGGYAPILFIILVAQAFLAFDSREALTWAVSYSLVIILSLSIISTVSDALLTSMVYLGAFIFFGAVTVSFRSEQAARARSDRLLQELEAAHAQLRDYASRVEQLAIAEERTRLAREIHDSLGHHLTLLSVQLQAASKLMTIDPGRASGEIEKARVVLADALKDVRQSVSALRANSMSELRLAQAVPRLIQEFHDTTGIIVNYSADEWPSADLLSPAQAITLYRTIQEGLTNIQKHARASRVDIMLEHLPHSMRLRMVDNGIGARQPTTDAEAGFGLMGLRERVELLGGTLTPSPRNGAGFELCVELPLSEIAGDA